MRTRTFRWLTAFGFLVAVPVAMYALAQKAAPRTASNPAASSKWVSHADPAGYSVQMPAGWTPSFSRERGWVQLMGAQGENAVIWPVFIPAPLEARTALFIHMQLAVASPFMADWGAPQAIASNVLRSSAVDQNMVAVSVFTWIPTPKGTLAYFYVTAARESDYRLKQDDFARILQSFRIIGAPAEHAKTGAAKYVQFADATETAYTIEVPVGWNTSGGVFRVNALDARPWVETVSPQADTRISMGDRDIPPFIEPMPNFPPGSWYAPYGFVQLVQPFTPGALFSRDYALNKIAQFCSNVEMRDVRDRPDLVRGYQQARPSSRGLVTAGDASFRCLQQGQPRIGWYAATTSVTARIPYVTWKVQELYGYVTAPGNAPVVEAILARMQATLQFNPEWIMAQIRLAGGTSQMISEAGAQIAAEAARRQRARDAADDEMSRRRSNATLGIVDVIDPATDRHITVESGSNYYWVDQRGVVVGTNTDARPSVDFRSLVQLP